MIKRQKDSSSHNFVDRVVNFLGVCSNTSAESPSRPPRSALNNPFVNLKNEV